MYQYRATVVRWIDGDTVDLDVDLGFHVITRQRFRLLGVDTPERGEPGYGEARQCAESVLPTGAVVTVETIKTDKYGRWLADLPAVRDELSARGLLKPAAVA